MTTSVLKGKQGKVNKVIAQKDMVLADTVYLGITQVGVARNTLRYKGYVGSVDFDADDRIFHGRVMGIKDVVTFEGASVDELEQDFHEAVDHYLEHCREIGKRPEKPFSGRFVLRIPSELHCAIAIQAMQQKKSINAWVAETCEHALLDV